MRGGAGVAVAQDSPRRREFFRLPQSLSFFPLSFYSLSILQGLGGFAARFRARSLDFLPAPVRPSISRWALRFPARPWISRAIPHLWRPPRPLGRPDDALRRPGGCLVPKADAIGILARRGGRLPPRARLVA